MSDWRDAFRHRGASVAMAIILALILGNVLIWWGIPTIIDHVMYIISGHR